MAWSKVPAKSPTLSSSSASKRPAAVFDGATPPFRRILDALERNQRVDTAQSAQPDGGALRLGGFRLGK